MNLLSIGNNSMFTHEEGLRALINVRETEPYSPPDYIAFKSDGSSEKAYKVSSMYGKGPVKRTKKVK